MESLIIAKTAEIIVESRDIGVAEFNLRINHAG